MDYFFFSFGVVCSLSSMRIFSYSKKVKMDYALIFNILLNISSKGMFILNLNTIFTATAWLISIVSIAVLFHVANADEHEVVLVDGVNIISGQRISFGYRFEGEIQGVFCRAELTDKPEIFCDWSRSTDAESINVSAAFVDNPRDSRNASTHAPL